MVQGKDDDPNMGQAITTDEPTQSPTPSAPSRLETQPGGVDPKKSIDKRLGRSASGRSGPSVNQPDYVPPRPPAVAAPGRRVTSAGGGVQVTLDGSGSWSELARQDATLPTDANNAVDEKHEGSGGVFGFLKGKKNRTNSPRPRERGVLGKEGARVVIG